MTPSQRATDALFDLTGRVAVVTGGSGLLGRRHAVALAGRGAHVVLADLAAARPADVAADLARESGGKYSGIGADITKPEDVQRLLAETLRVAGGLDILVNNAANNPKVKAGQAPSWSRLENFPLDAWEADVRVGLTGAFLCSQVLGSELARRGRGVIVNVASDLGVIAPDQRIYRQPGLAPEEQPVKPVTYSVVKTGLIGLTRYLATYWAEAGVRVNAISPGGVYDGQPEAFLSKLTPLIPLGRMADKDEYMGALVFLCSDASSYMTGTNLVVDGGRSCW